MYASLKATTQSSSPEIIYKYYGNLRTAFEKYELQDRPQFNCSPELKALGELIGWDLSRRTSVLSSVRTFRHKYL